MPKKVITDQQKDAIRHELSHLEEIDGWSRQQIADRYKVSVKCINDILDGFMGDVSDEDLETLASRITPISFLKLKFDWVETNISIGSAFSIKITVLEHDNGIKDNDKEPNCGTTND